MHSADPMGKNTIEATKRSSINASLGLRIRKRRKSIGMTQADLAAAIGVSFQQIQKYEKGLSSISQSRIHQICEVMSLPLDYFTDETLNYIGKAEAGRLPREGDDGQLEARFLASSEGRRLIESFVRISDPQLRTRVLDFITALGTDSDA